LIKESFYKIEEVDKTEDACTGLPNIWIDCNESLSDTDRKAAMNQVNPKYVLRNYMSQLAIEVAEGRLFANRRTTFTIEKSVKIKTNTTNGSLKGRLG
jgi:uncharacterized protein YdiU (UPF0061 family)